MIWRGDKAAAAKIYTKAIHLLQFQFSYIFNRCKAILLFLQNHYFVAVLLDVNLRPVVRYIIDHERGTARFRGAGMKDKGILRQAGDIHGHRVGGVNGCQEHFKALAGGIGIKCHGVRFPVYDVMHGQLAGFILRCGAVEKVTARGFAYHLEI